MDSSSPDQFSNEVQGQIGEARERLDAFLALSGAASGDEIVRTFDAIRRPLDVVVGRIGLLSSVHPDGKLRDRAERLEQEVVAFETEMYRYENINDAAQAELRALLDLFATGLVARAALGVAVDMVGDVFANADCGIHSPLRDPHIPGTCLRSV